MGRFPDLPEELQYALLARTEIGNRIGPVRGEP
jgi:hypothetical protein